VLEHALPGGLAGESATAPEKVFASFFKKKRFLSVLRQETATDGEPIWDNEALESSMMSVLHTPRLILMPWRAGDWPRLQGLWNLPEVRRYLWDDTLVPDTLAQQVVAAAVRDGAAKNLGLWCIHPRTDVTALAGFCGFRSFDAGDIEILYGLAGPYWGRGLVDEAMRAALAWFWSSTDYAVVVARTDPPNVKSVGVMRRLGMIEAGGAGPYITYRLARPARC
jgi:RimJ/RimL family protein N-acetyltransferase